MSDKDKRGEVCYSEKQLITQPDGKRVTALWIVPEEVSSQWGLSHAVCTLENMTVNAVLHLMEQGAAQGFELQPQSPLKTGKLCGSINVLANATTPGVVALRYRCGVGGFSPFELI